MNRHVHARGFTLIELSIVLVIIGLIAGGILTGRDLIKAAEVRATISQIEKYQTAVNTFRGKYDALPGDIADPAASNFGFLPRGSLQGQGDGNGILESNSFGNISGEGQGLGEIATFWVDLSAAHLVDGEFNTADPTSNSTPVPVTLSSSPNVNAYLPQAKIGSGNYVSVMSLNSINYFALSAISSFSIGGNNPGLTVQQALSIDTKIDDGMPETGAVLTGIDEFGAGGPSWVGQGGFFPNQNSWAPLSSASCSDNGGGNTPPVYSLITNASLVNCALTFRFQ